MFSKNLLLKVLYFYVFYFVIIIWKIKERYSKSNYYMKDIIVYNTSSSIIPSSDLIGSALLE